MVGGVAVVVGALMLAFALVVLTMGVAEAGASGGVRAAGAQWLGIALGGGLATAAGIVMRRKC